MFVASSAGRMSDRQGQGLCSLISLLCAAGNCWQTSSGTGAAWVTPKKFLCTVSLGMSSGELPRLSPGDSRQKTSVIPAVCVRAPFAQRGGNLERDSYALWAFLKGKGQGRLRLTSAGAAAHPAQPAPLTSAPKGCGSTDEHGGLGAASGSLNHLAPAPSLFWHACLSQLNFSEYFYQLFLFLPKNDLLSTKCPFCLSQAAGPVFTGPRADPACSSLGAGALRGPSG